MNPNEVFIDFESYYDEEVSVKTLGNVNYAKKSYAYIVSIVRGNAGWCGEIKDVYGPAENPKSCPQSLRPDPEKDYPLAANSNFDETFWDVNFPKFKNPWNCVLDRARGRQLPDNLEALAKIVLNRVVDKSIRTGLKGKHWDNLSPEAKQVTLDYCLNDGYSERDCWDSIKPLTEIEERIARHTRMTNRRGVNIDIEAVKKAEQTLRTAKHQAFLKIPWQEYAKPLSYDHFAQYCLKHGVQAPASLAKDDEDCSDWIKANPGVAQALVAMRTYRKSNTMLEKVGSLKTRLVDGILPMDLIYCGAPHTRRASSRGFNIQNLEKEGVTFEVPGIEAKDTTIWPREFIIPRPGKSFVILDLSQIEPRCLAWWVGDEKLLEGLRKGFAIYEAYARGNMGWTGGKLKAENPKLYATAKASVLGAGYGCGAEKFRSYAKTNIGLELTEIEAKQIIKAYRDSNPLVTRLWRTFDQLISQTVREGGKRNLEITMPTGDSMMQYRISPTLKGGHSALTVRGENKSINKKLWGGVLTENVIQRMARDVLFENIVNIEDAGIPVLFSVHDELILEIETEDAPEALKFATGVMRTPPEWCPDLPLDVEGGIFSHYTK